MRQLARSVFSHVNWAVGGEDQDKQRTEKACEKCDRAITKGFITWRKGAAPPLPYLSSCRNCWGPHTRCEVARLEPEPGPGFLPYMQEDGLPRPRSSVFPWPQPLETFLGSRPPWLSSLCAAARPRPLSLWASQAPVELCRGGGMDD